METNKNSYQLRQGEKEYILVASLIGETIKIVCNSFKHSFAREFTLDELRSLDQIFYNIKSPKEAIDYIDKALRIQKVGVKEEEGKVKIIFYIITKGIVHQIDIPLGKRGKEVNTTKNITTTNEEQTSQNQIGEYTATNYTATEENIQNIGEYQNTQNLENVELTQENNNFDVNQFLGQTTTNTTNFTAEGEQETFNSLENFTNTQDIAGGASADNEFISQPSINQNYDTTAFDVDNSNANAIGELATSNEEFKTDNIMQTNAIETTSSIDQLVEGTTSSTNEYFQTNLDSNFNIENYMKTLPTKILPGKEISGSGFEHIESHYSTNSVPFPSFNTNQYLGNLESSDQYIRSYDTTSIEPAILPTPTLPIINDAEITSNDNIAKEVTASNDQFTADQEFNLNKFTAETSAPTETNEQFTTGQEFNLNQFTAETNVATATNEQFTAGQEFNLNQFTAEATSGTETNNQFASGQEFNLNQFVAEATSGIETTNQFTSGQEFNLNQFTAEGTTTNEEFKPSEEFNLNQFTNETTEGAGVSEQFVTGQDFNLNQFATEATKGTETTEKFTTGQELNLNQFTTEGNLTNEQFDNIQDFSSNQFTTQDYNLNQFGNEAVTENKQFETQEYTTNQYTSTQFSTQDFSANQYGNEVTATNNFDMNQLLQNKAEEVPPVPSTQLSDFNQGYKFEETTTQNYVETQSTLMPTFAQPAFDKTNANTNLNLGSDQNIFSNQVTFNLPKKSAQPEFNLQPQPTLDVNANKEQPQQSQFDITLLQEQSHYKVSEYKEPEYNVQEYVATSPVPNYDDGRINKLEGDTNSLRNEHQLIQDKLNALSGEINIYKNQLGAFEKEKAAKEVDALKAENMAIKQQLSELNNLRNTAAEVNVLRNQLAELDPLRKKAADMEILKSQLRELNDLKAKVAELNVIKSQLGELNQLKEQLNQMNSLKGELNTLRIQAANSEDLRRKIEQMETAKIKQDQEIENLRNSQQIEFLKMKKSRLESNSKQLLFEEKTRNITVKGDIIQNMNELEMLTRKINKTNKKITLNLLYKASFDSDKASAFHERCDNANSSLVLIETDKGKRFGGFTTCSWRGNCIDKKDEEAFVFSLDKMMIYDNIPGEDAIGCYPKFGPIFLGCQIRIYDNAFSKGGTTFEKGLNYNTEEDFELTGGDRIFGVKEIEVYEVIV